MLLILLLAFHGFFSNCQSHTAQKTSDTHAQAVVTTEKEDIPEPIVSIAEDETSAETTMISEPAKNLNQSTTETPSIKEEKVEPAPTTTSNVEEKDIVIVEEVVPDAPLTDPTPPVVERIEAPSENVDTDEAPIEVDHEDHSKFDALLQAYVKDGRVNYKGFKSDVAKLDSYLSYLSSHAPSTSDKSPKALAFWMNAYNAFTIKLIIDNYPTSSIKKLYGGKAWDQKWIELGGKTYSLNQIEHDIIRPVFNDARIHFAIVCAAKSCPPLYNRAFDSGNVDRLLDQLTSDFINDPSFNTITESKVTISSIFDWYAKDFGKSVVTYLQKYAKVSISDKAKVRYGDYDWALNE